MLGMIASNSGTEVGVARNGELDGDGNSPVMVKTVQAGTEWAAYGIVVVSRRGRKAEWAVGVIVVVGRRGSGTDIIIWVTARVKAGRGEGRQRSSSDPGSS